MVPDENKYYLKGIFSVPSSEEGEILLALLAADGWEGFEWTDDELIAYIPYRLWDENRRQAFLSVLPFPVEARWEKVEEQNWNALWESRFQPIEVGDVYIRADFHPPAPAGKKEIVIHPRMSFGTGHHATTQLMLKMLFEEDLKGRSLIDMGSGTGILAIYAAGEGAFPVTAVDNDIWAYRNMQENAERNRTENIRFVHGDAGVLPSIDPAHYFLANINRNIILQDLPAYVEKIVPGGKLMLSGFYETDVPVIREAAEALGLAEEKLRVQDGWAGMKFVRSKEKS